MDGDVFSAAVSIAPWPTRCGDCCSSRWTIPGWKSRRDSRTLLRRDLKFSALADLIADALLEHSGSGNRPSNRRRSGGVPVSITSAYEKLGSLRWRSARPCSRKAPEDERGPAQIPAVDPLPDCWADYEVFGADGKAIEHVQRLLKPLRGLQAGILGGRASVGLNLRTGLA